MSTPLRELGGGLSVMNFGGLRLPYLLFECPNPGCARGHSQGIPYSDQPFHTVPGFGGAGVIRIWQRVSGTTIDDITLSPSIVVESCDGLHGHVVAGQWVPC